MIDYSNLIAPERRCVPTPCNMVEGGKCVFGTFDKEFETMNLWEIDNPTDVLSFPMFSLEAGNPPKDWDAYIDPESGLCPLGDMVISLERAVAQAKEFGHTTRREIGYLTIHSMLHLLGYDHLDEGPEKAQMRAREEEISSKIPRMQRV